ncbi:hypothetical protein [Pseudoalteromonas aurantia]|uniref:Uncharacterized protein n=1 Tax=Pseudoalteromonas aurantia 208 TaxID=1314867 RepID=A0ABR9E9Z6_9GAMM|nr:hypothetical protein [Pseudoalteromonas aurantia]MBE0367816.1 hypothetical protein [Pseudoalteromonas aurantia 208]
MKFVQSNTQGIKFRIYTYVMKLALPTLVPFILSIANGEETFAIQYLCFLLAAALLVSMWLLIFNTGESKIDAYSIELNKSGIFLTKFGESKSLLWRDYTGFSIGGIPKNITVKNNQGIEFLIGYYMFNSDQSAQIIAVLKARSPIGHSTFKHNR